MACNYFYKGILIGDEFQLNDFLINNKYLFDNSQSDIVFQKTKEQQNTEQRFFKHIEENTNRKKKIKPAINTVDGEVEYEVETPYIGVTTFLESFKAWDDSPLFPIFVDENYWFNKKNQWKDGLYADEDETILLGTVLNGETYNQNGTIYVKGKPITDENTLNNFQKLLTEKWKVQNLAGIDVHEVLRYYFSWDSKNKRIRGDQSIDKLFNQITNLKVIKVNLSKEHIRNVLDICERLKNSLREQFPDCSFWPEFTVSTELEDGRSILGRIDLVVVDNKGLPHIIDFKTSPKSYNNYNKAKVRTFYYQTAVYNRILRMLGINTDNATVSILPIQFTNFRRENEEFVWDGVKVTESEEFPLLVDITQEVYDEQIQQRIDEFMPYQNFIEVNPSEVTKNVKDKMTEWFPDFSEQDTEEEYDPNNQDFIEKIKQQIEPYITHNTETNTYIYKNENSYDQPIMGKDVKEVVQKYIKQLKYKKQSRHRRYTEVVQYLKEGIKKKGFKHVKSIDPIQSQMGKDADQAWLVHKLQKYTTGEWEILDNENINPLLEQFQIIILQNNLGQIDVIGITSENPFNKYKKKVKGTDYLTYNFASDFQEQIKPNSLVLERREGNIQAMQIMLILNELNLFSGKPNTAIGEIRVINTKAAKEINPSNEELFYNWALLNRYSAVKNDNFKSGKRKLLDKYHLLFQELHHIITWAKNDSFKSPEAKKFAGFESCILEYQATINDPISKEQRIKRIEQILRLLEKERTINPSKDLATNEKRFNRVYKLALKALAQEKNVNFRQQLDDHEQYYGKLSLKSVLKGSISGTLIDNPGSLESELLNLTSKLTTQAYQGIRDELTEPVAKLRQLGEKLVNAKQLTWWNKNVTINYSKLFDNMYIKGPRIFRFKNPWDMNNDLIPEEREYLKYALLLINKNKYGSHNSDESILARREKDPKFFDVPLKQGTTRNRADVETFWDLLKSKVRSLTPEFLYKQQLKENQGIDMSELKEYDQTNEALNYQMTNLFSAGDGNGRIALLEDPENVYDTNLENILIAHTFAYSQKRHIDQVFPLLKAAMFHLIEQGNNKGQNFEKDISYFENYIKAKILGKSIVEKQNQQFNKYVNYVRQAASYAALALSPVTGFGQLLQGLWNSIKVTLAQSNSPDAFNLSDLRKAFILCYRDMFTTKEPTLMQLINELYALNDMDMNVHKIEDAMKSDKYGILNISRFLFKTVSRPDYYNRGILFAAQMIHDGTLDTDPEVSAHYVKDGKLIYDIKRDKRFSALNDKNNPDYHKQMALYREMCKQFTIENVKNSDGSLFKVPKQGDVVALPRAYVNLQAESMKALSDMIYGYYSHEKKSLIHNMMVGGLIMQMRTFLSAKKQQYLAKGSSTLRGSFEHLKDENGKLLYYGLNEDGTPNEDIIQSETPNNFPVVRWVGQYGEGIFASFADLTDVFTSPGDGRKILSEWLADAKNKDSLGFARCYNYISLLYDLGMVWLISPVLMSMLADWYDELEDELADGSVIDSIRLTAANVFVKSMEYSVMDFDIWNSLFSPVLSNIHPFALTYLGSIPKRFVNAWTSDQSDTYDAIINSFGVTRQLKPFFDCIKPEWAYDDV